MNNDDSIVIWKKFSLFDLLFFKNEGNYCFAKTNYKCINVFVIDIQLQ